jgi:hypothetical protein
LGAVDMRKPFFSLFPSHRRSPTLFRSLYQNSSNKKKISEDNIESSNKKNEKFSKRIPAKALIDALNQSDQDSFIPIDKKQLEKALVEHEHSLTHDSFY